MIGHGKWINQVPQNWFEQYSWDFWQMVVASVSACYEPSWIFMAHSGESLLTEDPAPINIRELWMSTETAWLKISPGIFWLLLESMLYKVAALHWAREGLHDNTRTYQLLFVHNCIQSTFSVEFTVSILFLISKIVSAWWKNLFLQVRVHYTSHHGTFMFDSLIYSIRIHQ